MELARLVRGMLTADPSLGPECATLDLAASLGALLDEMSGEGVPIEELERIDVGDMSRHWQRSMAFLSIASQYSRLAPPGPEARRRSAVSALSEAWSISPPEGPVIVAGSTGSRGTTSDIIKLVHGLEKGCVVLPGFDFDLPDAAWESLRCADATEDHPQFRFASLLGKIGAKPCDVRPWQGEPPDPERNRFISLALRPAPVTDQWSSEGPKLRSMAGESVPATAQVGRWD